MTPMDALAEARDLVLRMLPHRASTGLVEVGRPTRSSPVLATGNYALTVRRLRRALAGRDVFVLVMNSRGINVWCAAGGGHLTHHDVVAGIRSSNVAEHVDHRTLVVPQLAATGIERRYVRDTTGWEVRWGPADLADLPAYLDRGARVRRRERSVTFPLRRRLEMASVWGFWMAILVGVLGALVGGARLALSAAMGLVVTVAALYALEPRLRIAGTGRWPTFAAFAVLGAGCGLGMRLVAGGGALTDLVVAAVLPAAMMPFLALDFAGTTPLFASDINTRGGAPHITLDADRCTGAAECVQVCPRDVLEMNGRRRKVEIARPGECIACGACIMQCPRDALYFRYDDGRRVGPDVIRKTRLNLLGRRAIRIE